MKKRRYEITRKKSATQNHNICCVIRGHAYTRAKKNLFFDLFHGVLDKRTRKTAMKGGEGEDLTRPGDALSCLLAR